MQRKYAINQRVRIKTNNGTHREPPREVKGASGTIAPQCTSDLLRLSNSAYAESSPSYYVEVDGGTVELVGEEWLEAL